MWDGMRHRVVKLRHLHFFRLVGLLVAVMREVSIEGLQEGPIVVELLLAETDGVEGDGYFEL